MINWIETTFNVSGAVTQAIAVILALVVVLLLFSLFIFVLKRLMGSRAPQSRNRQPRVAVMDSTSVDARRHLVLIRRDNVEHLLLIGGPTDVVVEQNIVRNAPGASSRPAPKTAQSPSVQANLKVPTAPGPDIPMRPDQSVQTRKRRPLADTGEAPVVSPRTKSGGQPMQAGHAAVNGAGPQARTANGFPAVTDPLVSDRSPSTGRRSRADSGSSAAADLLRAATQNGFNRAAQAPLQKGDAPVENPAAGEAAVRRTVKAPEVKPETAVKADAETEASGGAGSPLKVLARSIAARERQSQTGHTITPPASGPAARAKTALATPVAAPAVEQGITPVAGDAKIKDETSPDAAAGASEAAGEVLGDMEPLLQVETGTADPAPDKPEASTVPEAGVAAGSDDDGRVPAHDSASVNGTEPEAPAEDTRRLDEQTPREIKLDLELGDLIDDSVSIPVDLEQKASDAPEPESQSQSQTREATSRTSDGPAKLDIVPGAERAPATGKVLLALEDKNPIEDEMAKLLHELGGQPNQ